MTKKAREKRAEANFRTLVEDLLGSVSDYASGWPVDPPAGYPFDHLVATFGERLSRVPLPDWACDDLRLPRGSNYLRAVEVLRPYAAAMDVVYEIDGCDAGDRAACDRLAATAADVAFHTRLPERFGYFAGASRCVVFANQGPDGRQRLTAEVLRQYLDDAGVAELGAGVSAGGDGYTWALLIDSPDGAGWCRMAREAFVVVGS